MSEQTKSLKEMCKIAREGFELSQRAFAKKVGSNRTEVSFIERGVHS